MRPQFHDLRESQLNSDDARGSVGGAAAAAAGLGDHDDHDNEGKFASLIKAHKGESVPISEVKKGVIKAIEVMLSKLYFNDNNNNTDNTNDRLIAVLSNARLVLMGQENS
jgi:hypothetical protein